MNRDLQPSKSAAVGGQGQELILDIFRPSLLYATDLDIAMLKKAGKYISSDKMEQIVLVAADGFCLPFKTGSLDAVFDFGVLHHIPDWRSALGEVARVLKIRVLFSSKNSILLYIRISSQSTSFCIRKRTVFAARNSEMGWMLPDFLSIDMENGKVLASLALLLRLRRTIKGLDR